MEYTMYEHLKEIYMLNKKNRPTIWAIYFFHPLQINKRPQESSDLETSKRLCFEGSSMILSWKVPKTAASCSFACNSGFAIITWNNPKK